MARPVISVHGVSKRYVLGAMAGHDTLRDQLAHGAKALSRAFQPQRAPEEAKADTTSFWALKDVSFDLNQGEVLGVVGRNGAGKSTLLKILSQITEPTEGEIRVRGRVASLLEVGTGFHPELSGRENVFLNGAILGMSRREIRDKFDEIVAFAEVERFLDTPVKRYSSGMYVRLAFAVAAHLHPEILIVDEVLAVGDASFQEKCMGKMQDAGKGGRTVIFVSHNMAAVNLLCSRTILLEKGMLVFDGPTAETTQRYAAAKTGPSGAILEHQKTRNAALEVEEITVNGSALDSLHLQSTTEPLRVLVRIRVHARCRVSLHAFLNDRISQALAIYSPGHVEGSAVPLVPGLYEIQAHIELPNLLKGRYSLDLGLSDPGAVVFADFPRGLEISVDGFPTRTGLVFEQGPVNGNHVLLGSIEIKPITP
jgi:lipopolysaccharide transport system ATP-binding protein